MNAQPVADDRRYLLIAGLSLAALMVLTRLGHFSELSRLPDASWAVFFLGGLALRDARGFAAFFGLAWLVDVAAVSLGTPADCFSVAYLFLVPAYGALWWAGRWAAGAAATAGARTWRAAAALVVGACLAFVVSNLGFYLFGVHDATLGAVDYTVRVARFLPGYLLVAALYAGGAAALATAVLRLRASAAR
jgi:hypothetical protein